MQMMMTTMSKVTTCTMAVEEAQMMETTIVMMVKTAMNSKTKLNHLHQNAASLPTLQEKGARLQNLDQEPSSLKTDSIKN